MAESISSLPDICCRCGQPVDLGRDSWTMGGSTREVRHISCPASQEAKAVPVVAAAEAATRPQYLTMEQAAQMLAVSVGTIRRRIRSGALPAKRLKGSVGGGLGTVLVDQADVLALLEPIGVGEVE